MGSYPPGALELTFSKGSDTQHIDLKRYQVFDIFLREYLRRERKKGDYTLEGDVRLDQLEPEEALAIRKTDSVNFLFTPTSAIAGMEERSNANDKELPERSFSDAFSKYLKIVGYSHSQARAFLDELSYIGPLRDRPKRYYEVDVEEKETVGAHGENAASIFRRMDKKQRQLVNRWIKRFEFGTALKCKQLTDDLFQLHLTNGSRQVNIADVGFGASQLLPLIIQGMAAPQDSLTLAEQPEIHLNPRLQCVLADLFVSMANAGHRVLIETHSEHLLLRLRSLVACGDIDSTEVAIYYVERQGEQSTIREVPLAKNGSIAKQDWPKDFFDDALRESLGLAAAQHSKKVRRNASK